MPLHKRRYFECDLEKMKQASVEHRRSERAKGVTDDVGRTFRFLEHVRHKIAGDVDVEELWKPLIADAKTDMKSEVDAYDKKLAAISESGLSSTEAQKKTKELAQSSLKKIRGHKWEALNEFKQKLKAIPEEQHTFPENFLKDAEDEAEAFTIRCIASSLDKSKDDCKC